MHSPQHAGRNNEPFWWALFGAGGALSALFLPVLLLINGIAVPLGWVSGPTYEHWIALVQHPVVRLFLMALITFSMFHWAHRFRFTLYEGLQLKHLYNLIAVLTYGTAIIVTLFAGYILLTFNAVARENAQSPQSRYVSRPLGARPSWSLSLPADTQ